MPDASTDNHDVLTYAFAPMHKAAFGAAVGLVSGSLVFLATVFHVIIGPATGPNLRLLAQYFYGYDVSWAGAFVGFFWAAVMGFVSGWFAAFIRNLVLSIALFALRTRADVARMADFLDHI
jgi:hypothetical protein